MAREFWYPIDSAAHNLPALVYFSNNAYSVTGTNINIATKPGGGRGGPMTHDDDTTYGLGAGNDYYSAQAFNISWPSPMLAYAGYLSAGYRDRFVSGPVAGIRSMIMFNAANAAGTAFLGATNSTTSFVTKGPLDISTAATYRPGAGSWTLTDFDDDQSIFPVHIYGSGAGGPTSGRVTSIFGEIEFSAPGGGFVFLLGIAGAVALRGVGVMSDFSHFMRFLEWRKVFHPRHTQLNDQEIADAWTNLKTYKWPTYFYGGLDAYTGCAVG